MPSFSLMGDMGFSRGGFSGSISSMTDRSLCVAMRCICAVVLAVLLPPWLLAAPVVLLSTAASIAIVRRPQLARSAIMTWFPGPEAHECPEPLPLNPRLYAAIRQGPANAPLNADDT